MQRSVATSAVLSSFEGIWGVSRAEPVLIGVRTVLQRSPYVWISMSRNSETVVTIAIIVSPLRKHHNYRRVYLAKSVCRSGADRCQSGASVSLSEDLAKHLCLILCTQVNRKSLDQVSYL